MYDPVLKQRVLQFADRVLTGKEIPAFAHFASPGYREHVGFDESVGIDGAKDRVAELVVAFPDAVWYVHECIADDLLVSTRYTFVGTHLGPFRDVPPTGAVVRAQGFDMIRFDEDEMFAERWVFLDLASVMEQLVPAEVAPESAWVMPDSPADIQTGIIVKGDLDVRVVRDDDDGT